MSIDATSAELPASVKRYATYLTTMAGLGGLLYGVDVGIIAAALPYIAHTSDYSPAQLALVVAAVLAGSVLSSLFAGQLAEWFGRKIIIILSALLFTLSIPVICLSDLMGNQAFEALVLGRILQGCSAGLIGVVVPMYLAECLDSKARGKGTGMFQLLLTVGLVFAATIGIVTTNLVGAADDVTVAVADKVSAWQTIFWCSAIPGILLFFGAFKLKESPRWLYAQGRKEEALDSLAANNGTQAANLILEEMLAADVAAAEAKIQLAAEAKGDSIFQRKYIIPFVLAVVILGCNQATGINSVLNYSVNIFLQAGLEGAAANWADFAIKIVNMAMTIVAVSLVDKKGRKFLLKMGTAGIIVGLVGVGCMFLSVEKGRIDVTAMAQAKVSDNAFSLTVEGIAKELKNEQFAQAAGITPGTQLIVNYTQGGSAMQKVVEYKDIATVVTPKGISKEQVISEAQTMSIAKSTNIKPNFMDKLAFWKTPTVEGSIKEVVITKAEIGIKPTAFTGWMVTLFFVVFIAFYAAGPGVCVWLALSELMPNRIRANGMAIALLINQGVSTTIAGVFLPWVGAAGYSSVFFTLGGFTVFYFITAAFFLPETKGRTLEEIEKYFSTGKMPEEKN